jgi:succinate dehydrogenase flavin-adding protein (antitoxin of CptAB toxin-antitoxin module)
VTELQQQTLDWISKQIDEINDESVDIGEMLLETEDKELIEVLDEKLKDLENQLENLNMKFQFEKKEIENKY